MKCLTIEIFINVHHIIVYHINEVRMVIASTKEHVYVDKRLALNKLYHVKRRVYYH